MENNKSLRDQYYEELINQIMKIEQTAKEEERTEESLLDLWKLELAKAVDKAFVEHIAKNRDTYMLTDTEIKDAWEKAGTQYVDEMIDKFVDEGLMEVSIDKKGTMLYGLTDHGKKLVRNHKK